jgi:hypothetical protein
VFIEQNLFPYNEIKKTANSIIFEDLVTKSIPGRPGLKTSQYLI